MNEHKLHALRKAIMDEGSHPLHHRQVMARHRQEWPVLWKAVDELVRTDKKTMITKESNLFIAPICPSCKKSGTYNFIEVTSFGDPTESYVLEWWCRKGHDIKLDPVDKS